MTNEDYKINNEAIAIYCSEIIKNEDKGTSTTVEPVSNFILTQHERIKTNSQGTKERMEVSPFQSILKLI